MDKIKELKKQGYTFWLKGALTANPIPVRRIGLAKVMEIEEWEDGRDVRNEICYAVDVPWNGIAGNGYDDDEHWYYTQGYKIEEETKKVIFDIPFYGDDEEPCYNTGCHYYEVVSKDVEVEL